MSKKVSKEKPFEKFGLGTSRIAGIVSSITIIIGGAGALCSWVSNQFANAVSSQINDFRSEVKETNDRQEQAIARVELLMIMEHDPENTLAIEKMARHYFVDLNGDLYMTQKYSDWAKKYGGDISIIAGVH